jgi:hypothetical protein
MDTHVFREEQPFVCMIPPLPLTVMTQVFPTVVFQLFTLNMTVSLKGVGRNQERIRTLLLKKPRNSPCNAFPEL